MANDSSILSEMMSPGQLTSNVIYQVAHPGLPLTVSKGTYQNFARYGLRGWRGATFGLSGIVTSPLVKGSEAIAKRTSWRGYRNIHGSINFFHQFMSGGSGPQGQITLLSGKSFLGPLSLTPGERAIADQMRRTGLVASRSVYRGMMMSAGQRLGLGESLAAALGFTGRAEQTLHKQMLAGLVGDTTDNYARYHATRVNRIATNQVAKQQMGGLVSKASAWKLGSSRVLSTVGAPLLGTLNTFFIMDLAFKAGELGGQLLGATAHALRNVSENISRLEMGGPVVSFQTGAAITERQRAVQAIQMNQLNARQAIGQEARFLHG